MPSWIVELPNEKSNQWENLLKYHINIHNQSQNIITSDGVKWFRKWQSIYLFFVTSLFSFFIHLSYFYLFVVNLSLLFFWEPLKPEPEPKLLSYFILFVCFWNVIVRWVQPFSVLLVYMYFFYCLTFWCNSTNFVVVDIFFSEHTLSKGAFGKLLT